LLAQNTARAHTQARTLRAFIHAFAHTRSEARHNSTNPFSPPSLSFTPDSLSLAWESSNQERSQEQRQSCCGTPYVAAPLCTPYACFTAQHQELAQQRAPPGLYAWARSPHMCTHCRWCRVPRNRGTSADQVLSLPAADKATLPLARLLALLPPGTRSSTRTNPPLKLFPLRCAPQGQAGAQPLHVHASTRTNLGATTYGQVRLEALVEAHHRFQGLQD